MSVDCSIVVPVYCNEGSLKKTFTEIKEKIISQNIDYSFEVIFVDDGSLDDSLQQLLHIQKEHACVKVVKLTRNFGQVSAILAGYKMANGRCVINISADLQDPPELMNDMLRYHFEEKYELVVCTRESREDKFFARVTSKIFYSIIKKLSFSNMPAGGFDFVLMGSKAKVVFLENQDSNPFFQGQILWMGFDIKFIPYNRKKREHGTSKWTFAKKLNYLIDGVMAYSYAPLRAISLLGFAVAFLGFLYAVVVFFARIFGQIPVEGWAPLIIVVLVLSGTQMLMLGIVGEYLWRVLAQTRNRSQYVIDEVYEAE